MFVDKGHQHIAAQIILMVVYLRRSAPLALSLLSFAACSAAAPVITQLSGTFSHNASVTITGTGFGTKAQAAPVVWDNASGTSFLSKWDGAWPSVNAVYNTDYRFPQRGVGLPHNNVSRYIAGAHYSSIGPEGGYNVVFWKNRTFTSYPAYTYASWYQRFDDGWVFGGDDNLKAFAFSVCCSPYELPKNWYIEYNPRPTSTASSAAWHVVDDSEGQPQQSLQDPSKLWGASAVNPMAGQWSKIEVEIKHTNQPDGYIRLWENGIQKIGYVGPTDRYAGQDRTIGIGGYARQRSTSNWRYYADVYLDYTLARILLANNADLRKATAIETQIPTSWNDTSITISVNLGKFTAGEKAYLFVVDSAGVGNAAGIPLVVGGTTTIIPPPGNLHF